MPGETARAYRELHSALLTADGHASDLLDIYRNLVDRFETGPGR